MSLTMSLDNRGSPPRGQGSGTQMPCAAAQTFRLPKRPKSVADLLREDLRLLPGREVPAFREPVVVNQLGIGFFGPTPRHLIELVRKDAHGYRNGDALRPEE